MYYPDSVNAGDLSHPEVGLVRISYQCIYENGKVTTVGVQTGNTFRPFTETDAHGTLSNCFANAPEGVIADTYCLLHTDGAHVDVNKTAMQNYAYALELKLFLNPALNPQIHTCEEIFEEFSV